MNFNEYQEIAVTTAVFGGDKHHRMMYTALGLNGEAGEVAEKVKKIVRDGYEPHMKTALMHEMGDCLWYLAALAEEMGIWLDDVAVLNVEKIKDRQSRDKIHGSGDDR